MAVASYVVDKFGRNLICECSLSIQLLLSVHFHSKLTAMLSFESKQFASNAATQIASTVKIVLILLVIPFTIDAKS